MAKRGDKGPPKKPGRGKRKPPAKVVDLSSKTKRADDPSGAATTPTQRTLPRIVPPRPAHRPRILDLTPEVSDAVAALVEKGVPISHAFAKVGISKATGFEWIQRGEAGDVPYSDFSDKIAYARANKVERLVAVLEEASRIPSLITGQIDWKPALELLARTEPDTFRPPPQRSEVTGKDGGPVQTQTWADLVAMCSTPAPEPTEIAKVGGETKLIDGGS